MTFLSALGAAFGAFIVFKIVNLFVRIYLATPTNFAKYGGKTGAWALVTGSTDGIGKEFALQLAKKGFNIMLVSRNAEKLKDTQQQIRKEVSGVTVETFALDFADSNKEGLNKLVSTIKDKEISILVNNVGVSHGHPEYFSEMSEGTIETIVNVNILNTLRLTHAILPGMVERKRGLIMNLGSFSGETPIPLLQTYSASKAFLKTWSMSLAAEVAKQGVDVQLLNTFFVVSNMSKRKRPTLMIPTPKDYVMSALRRAGQSDLTTPYPMHALLNAVMGLVPTNVLTAVNLGQMRATRQKALQKAQKSNQ